LLVFLFIDVVLRIEMGAVPFQFFCPLRKKGDSKAAEGAEKGDNVVV
jgi:hypothetical protein